VLDHALKQRMKEDAVSVAHDDDLLHSVVEDLMGDTASRSDDLADRLRIDREILRLSTARRRPIVFDDSLSRRCKLRCRF
jgi:hypothetical protein